MRSPRTDISGATCALIVAALLLPSPAGADSLTYTFQGRLNRIVGFDTTNLLHGATLTIVATADTLQAPAQTESDSGFQSGRYAPSSITATVTNRPGGAPNLTFSYSTQLVASNLFAPLSNADSFFLDSNFAPSLPGLGFVQMPGFSIDFTSQTFFPGTGIPSLPLFTPTDVGTLFVGRLEVNFGNQVYSVVDPIIPPPGAHPLTYTFQGTLNALGSDTKLLHGASLRIVVTAHASQAPTLVESGSGSHLARYNALSVTATLTNRPGGAQNQTFSYAGHVLAANLFPPVGIPDWLALDSASTTIPGIGMVTMPAFQVNFTGQTFFAGTTPPLLRSFTPADVGTVQPGILQEFPGPAIYQVVNSSASAKQHARFTDSTLVSGATPVRAIQLLELRARIDAVRAARMLPQFQWTDDALTGVVIQRTHVLELRNALEQAFTSAGLTPPAYTGGDIIAGSTFISAVHILELRTAVISLE